MKGAKDNLNKRVDSANPKKKRGGAPAKAKSFGALGASASAPPAMQPPMMNSPYNMQGMP